MFGKGVLRAVGVDVVFLLSWLRAVFLLAEWMVMLLEKRDTYTGDDHVVL